MTVAQDLKQGWTYHRKYCRSSISVTKHLLCRCVLRDEYQETMILRFGWVQMWAVGLNLLVLLVMGNRRG